MTTEQKAKAYDEALKRAEAAIDIAADKDLVKGVATTIFPELKESENERIRKWLYDYISNCPNNNFDFYGGVGKDAVLNYLEKQKEAENVSASTMIPSWWGEEQKQEQKSAEWSEEDEEMLLSIINAFRNGTVSTIGQEQWLKSLRPHPHWKPSEEQIEYLSKAIYILGEEGDCRTAAVLNELRKDLKNL